MRLAVAVFCLLAPFVATAEEEDIVPRFGALEDAKLAYSLTRSFDGYDLPTGPFTRDEKPVRKLEGRVREWVYQIESEASTLEAIRNYEQRLAELGYEFLFECAQNECGGFDFRFGIDVLPPPAMYVDLGDFHLARVFGRKLFQCRADLLAGATPFGPEIDHDRDVGILYFGVKSGVRDSNGGHIRAPD